MKKWELFSEEELIQFFKEENTFEDLQKRLGYSYRSERNNELKKIAETLGIDINFYTTKSNTNLQGKIYNHLKVLHIDLEKSGKGKGTYWTCQCLDCEKIFTVRADALRGHNQINCGCTKRSHLIKKKFGKLTVISEVGRDNNRNVLYECECECGNKITVAATKLITKQVVSCGCYWNSREFHNKQIKDLKDQIYGQLKVLEIDENKSDINKKIYWKCLCLNCGTITSVSRNNLHKGQISCGCVRSKGEKAIIDLLKKYNLNYKKEISFENLYDKKKLRYDFGIYNDQNVLIALIEYQGIQHYQPIDFFGGIEAFKKQQEHDKEKYLYCEKNNIPLIIFQNLEDINIEKINEVIK